MAQRHRRYTFGLLAVSLLAIGLPAALPATAAMGVAGTAPHYFGPWPNWANSPLTLPSVNVTIDDPNGPGSGATASASVGANGSITGITVLTAGQNYDETTTVTITGAGTGATAMPIRSSSASVTSIDLTNVGSFYEAPVVTIGGPGIGAAAVAAGGVDSIVLSDPGSGYTMPTVDFDMPDDPNGVQAEGHVLWDTATGVINSVIIDNPGSGYYTAPNVVIHNGTALNPLVPDIGAPALVLASAHATISVTEIIMQAFGDGYTSAPTVTITEGSANIGQPGFVPGSGATAIANVVFGAVIAVIVTNPGTGYITAGGIEKFTDALPLMCDPAGVGCDSTPGAKFIPLAVPDTTTYVGADTYEIAVVQYKTNFSSSLPDTLVRGYVQLETPATAQFSQHVPLINVLRSGETQSVLVKGVQAYGVTAPQYLGPIISATKNRPSRVVFRNLLPTGVAGDLFLPVDTSMMGSGEGNMDMPYDPTPTTNGTTADAARNPMCTADRNTMGDMCYSKNRATLHLHGGNTPWISDGTVHQWITPAGETTVWPQGVDVHNVPDMNECAANEQGCMTFFYTNQQSARLMWVHDHSFGITRLNVYAGEAMGYLLTDKTEQKLVADGTLPADQLPLIIQDKTFVPQDSQLYDQIDPATGAITSYGQDPTWDKQRWGDYGSLWYHHVYMPAQNPSNPAGTSSYGRWLYGPWFWPPATDVKYGPIMNPYYDAACNLNDPATWQYDVAPFCEPALNPGTPNISAGMEQFNDTPLVNGTAYPTLTVQPKSYRFRILNAANDRFFNLQWYVGEASTASTRLNKAGATIGATEVALKAAEVAAAKTDPNVFPTPDLALSAAGPDWIQIGTEGGFLPAPTVVSGHQPITWITDPTRFDVGNVDLHSLLLGNAERADVVVDFSKYAGKTLILYNDAPAAFPARSAMYDYYTDKADLRPAGSPTTLPGYGPNTRTVMQVKVAAAAPAPAFNLLKLRKAFGHKADGSGVFESSENPIIVGQAAYNSAYGSKFVQSGWCNSPSSPSAACDGFARITDQGGTSLKFDTLSKNPDGTTKQLAIPVEPKSMHDETNATSYDEFGRMQANLGVELFPATPGIGGAILYGFSAPSTEIFDASHMPYATDGAGNDIKIRPISTLTDGTQIWKLTHNGVDTHPIHFHAFDVQLLNRVTWDNIILAPDPNELGWKETVRVSPLEDTYFAIRPVLPKLPWELPNSVRLLDVTRKDGNTIISNTIAGNVGVTTSLFSPDGTPIDLDNKYVNFGASYVWHCHILSHEEMDMMRPMSFAMPPLPATAVTAVKAGETSRTVTVSWVDSSIAETGYMVERRVLGTTQWTQVKTVTLALDGTQNTKGTTLAFTDRVPSGTTSYQYRVFALNAVGDPTDYTGAGVGNFPTVTARSVSAIATASAVPNAPTNVRALALGSVLAVPPNPPYALVTWQNTSALNPSFIIERMSWVLVNGKRVPSGAWAQVGTAAAGTTAFTDRTVDSKAVYSYRVFATANSLVSLPAVMNGNVTMK